MSNKIYKFTWFSHKVVNNKCNTVPSNTVINSFIYLPTYLLTKNYNEILDSLDIFKNIRSSTSRKNWDNLKSKQQNFGHNFY